MVRNLVKSRVGRSMVAVRDNTTAAAVMGVNVAITKTVVFGLSAALAGLAGCTFALRQTQATPDNLYFTILGSIIFLVIMVIGGTGSLLGPIVGAFVYYRVEEFTRELPDEDLAPGLVQRLPRGPRQPGHDRVRGRCSSSSCSSRPFGIVGLAKRFGRRIVLVVPKPPPGHGGAAVEVAPPGSSRRTRSRVHHPTSH